ncbi:hypothetical protein H8S75_31405 [Hungatella sp. L12]|uniref:Uncharacterized protein n=1 Tax=Hungatella hominis TaxID=2763050 RepID=A0ABR7HH01_9FIRM|nr:hypothetical protein [Hungatella hominis]MBC5712410.1 hypothetical protein [Hungatella hominis]
MGVLCGIVIALFVGGAIAVLTISLCMAANDGDAERERMEQANEILNLRLENEYLHMWQAEVRESIDQMEPPEGFPPVYCHAYNDTVKAVKKIVN